MRNIPQSSDLKIVFSITMMVRFDHMLMPYKTNVEGRKGDKMCKELQHASLNNPAHVTTNSSKPYDSKFVKRSMQMQNLPEK